MAIAQDFESYHSFATDATDSTGNHNGTLLFDAIVTNGNLVLDGTNDACETNLYAATSQVTVSLIVNFNSFNNIQYVFGDYSSSGNGTTARVTLNVMTDGNWRVIIGNNSTNWLGVAAHGLSVNTDYEVQLEIDGTAVEIRVNGGAPIILTSTVSLITASSYKWTIGRAGEYATDLWLDGSIRQVYRYHRILTVLEQHSLTYRSFGFPTDFIAHYTMDNIVGSTLKDETGTYDGAITGAVPVAGVLDNALSFNGADQYINLGDVFNDLIVGAGKYTLSFWFSGDAAHSGTLFSKLADTTTGGSARQLLIRTITGKVTVRSYSRLSGTEYREVQTANVIADGTMHHIVITYDGAITTGDGLDRVEIHVDAVKQSTVLASQAGTLGTTPTSTALFGIGAALGLAASAPSYEFIGNLDQIRVYNRTVSQSEVDMLYTEGSLINGLVAHYTMDNVSGTTLLDETGTNDATITGATQVDGHLGKALSFNGSDQFLTLPYVPATKTHTVSFWMKFAANTAIQVPYSLSEEKYEMHTNINGSLRVFSNDAAGVWDSGISLLVVGTVYHILVIHSPTPKLYLNGVDRPLTFTSVSTTPSVSTVHIGKRSGITPYYFNGWMDQFRIYDRSLVELEIDALYYEELLEKFLTGTITETLGVTNWHVRSYRLDNGLLTASVDTTDGTFNLTIGITDHVPHLITVSPDQGDMWRANTSKIINQLMFPTNPSTTPYYFKVTIAGTSGASEPAWNTTPTGTTVDGTITWEVVERMVQPITHAPLIPQ